MLVAYLFVNILFLAVCLAYSVLIKKKEISGYVLFAFSVIFALISAFRPMEMPDTNAYVYGFYDASFSDFADVNLFGKKNGAEFEYGYVFLMCVFKLFSSNVRVFFFLTTIVGLKLSVMGMNRLCRISPRSREVSSGKIFILYVAAYGLLYHVISVRMGLAMGLGLFAMNHLIEKKWVKASVLLLIAFTLQRMAIMFLIMYFIIKYTPKIINKKIVHTCCFVTMGILMFSGASAILVEYALKIISLIFQRLHIGGYEGYLTTLDNEIGLKDMFYWLQYGILIYVGNFRDKLYYRYLNVVAFGTLIVTIFFPVRAISRVYDLFYIFLIPLFNMVYCRGKKDSFTVNKALIIFMICLNAVLTIRTCFVNIM